MEQTKQEFLFNIRQKTVQHIIPVKQGDNTFTVVAAFSDGARAVYPITDGCTVCLRGVTPAGNQIYNLCEKLGDNKIAYTFSSNLTATPGEMECEFVFTGENGEQITAPKFILQVNTTAGDETQITQTGEFTVLQKALRDALQAKQQGEELIGQCQRLLKNKQLSAEETNAANGLIEQVLAVQSGRTFTFAALSDLHLGSYGYQEGTVQYSQGVEHAARVLGYLDERIHLDALAVLGDYTDGMALTQPQTAREDFLGVNALLGNLRYIPNLRIGGNHDFSGEGSPLPYQTIGGHSDGSVTWGNHLGGYFYKDFEPQKLRVICLNTSEQTNECLSCSDEQYRWFVDALDLSEKQEGKDWQILILSHIPLDMWVNGAKYRFAYILDAYQKGTNWTDGVISCDYSGGKNTARLVGNIHGHVHNFATDKLYKGNIANPDSPQIDVWRMATPNACLGLENKNYQGYKQSKTYAKTPYSVQDTAFCVYCVNLDTFTIHALCYGAGYNRILNYKQGVLTTDQTYSVTNYLSDVTNSNGLTAIASGASYTATLTAVGELSTVTVTMGGVDITPLVYQNGVITIPTVTGDIVITAGATPLCTVTYHLTNVTSTDQKTVAPMGKMYTTALQWEGELKEISVTMGGNDITATVFSEGIIYIAQVTGDIVITALAEELQVVNQLPISTGADNSVYNASDTPGYKKNTRWSGSSQAEQEYTGLYLSGYIPAKTGDIVRMKNVNFITGGVGASIVWHYYEKGTQVYQRSYDNVSEPVYDENGKLVQFTVDHEAGLIRIQCCGLDETSVITVNGPIE